jgi:hypothetical protein
VQFEEQVDPRKGCCHDRIELFDADGVLLGELVPNVRKGHREPLAAEEVSDRAAGRIREEFLL